ncbi:hypothetical protein RHSIM_Rhsim09G0026400 [Rhododendron simsii]|uniref:Cysteine--tRNA ligase n=1 Tax=Rhododendron simsii TaxID=118357 RepID=A0A834LCE9_RHOSS|nr:hypothetical protein RHSIM_Rhsim09G0026400 [Rhododendron simsii]
MVEVNGKEVKLIATPAEQMSLLCNSSNTKSEEVIMSQNSVTNNNLYIYNSMTREKELFVPQVPRKFGMYISAVSLLTTKPMSAMSILPLGSMFCTDTCWLLHLGFDVVYVRNFTDVDDKIIAKANMREENIFTLANHSIGKFHDDMCVLQCLAPKHEPRVTSHIEQIISMIDEEISLFLPSFTTYWIAALSQDSYTLHPKGDCEIAIFTSVRQMHSLPVPQEKSSSSLHKVCTIHNDCAYVVDGDVYFSLDKYPNFGCLSGNSQEDLLVTPDPKKRDPHDFALWKGKPKQHLPLIQSLIEIEKAVKEVLSILGLLSPLSYTEVVLQLKEKALDRANMKEDQAMDLIRKRAQARKERDFSSSDQIRRDLAAKGIALMDVDKETIWRPCVPHKHEDQALLTLC